MTAAIADAFRELARANGRVLRSFVKPKSWKGELIAYGKVGALYLSVAGLFHLPPFA